MTSIGNVNFGAKHVSFGKSGDVHPQNAYKDSPIELDIGEEPEEPALTKAIYTLYQQAVKEKKEVPTEHYFENYKRREFDSRYDSKGFDAKKVEDRILDTKVKLDDDTFALLGKNPVLYERQLSGKYKNVPEAYIKVVDKDENVKTAYPSIAEIYVANNKKNKIKLLRNARYDYDKMLLKVADKLCPQKAEDYE